ncbi:DMT family transporter [Alkalihalobacillus sp. MEB130]|uniref:DMT family transporter n=1 Tax=Alkalihalobacillus sp. MEB130 TaxID=2976704 RepID=UPI0028DEEC27|nr:DMT family transporter [Alkalihalobacillus sp. MEB130]MDT8862871.1 DMT family transporter [Alkalihalobacillus sp. MEB130]
MKGLMLFLCVIWGFNFVIMKLGNDVFPPVLFAAYRFLLGALVLFGITLLRKIPLPGKRELKWYILCGLLQTTYFNIAIQISLNYISAGLTSVLTYSMPLFLSLMAHYFIPGEKLNAKKTGGILIGIFGLFLAMDISIGGNIWASVLALSSAIIWALSNLIFKKKLQGCDAVQFTTWQMAIGAIGLFLFSITFESGQSHWSLMAVVYLLYSGVLASALAFVIWSHILSKMEASKASISLLIVPIVGTLSGVIFLKEELNTITLVGIIFVLLGVWLVNYNGSIRMPLKNHSLLAGRKGKYRRDRA